MRKNVCGLIYAGEENLNLRELVNKRSVGALPVGGRYRAIDFVLSNMVNSGIRNIGVIPRRNYHSMMDHLGSGKEWDLNRKEDGLSLGLKIEENTIHCDMRAVSARGFMNWKKVRQVSDRYIKMLKTKGTSATQVVNLSGGNQQKVAIAKWLHAGCNLLIFDEPTRGIDVAAKAEIHQLIRDFAAQKGKAAIVISSEVNELVSVSDRIIVMSKGQITGELEAEEIEQNNVLRHITTKGR